MIDSKTDKRNQRVRFLPHAILADEELFERFGFIESQLTSPDINGQDIAKLVEHKDERLLIALLYNEDFRYWDTNEKKVVELKALARALQTAVESDEVWNPIIEALGVNYSWPSPQYSAGTGYNISYEQYLEENLAPWAKSQSLEEALHFIERTDSVGATSTVLANMVLPEVDEFISLLEAHPYSIAKVATRSDLPRDYKVALKDLLVRGVLDSRKGSGQAGEHKKHEVSPEVARKKESLYEWGIEKGLFWEAYRHRTKQGDLLQPAQRDTLIAALASPPGGEFDSNQYEVIVDMVKAHLQAYPASTLVRRVLGVFASQKNPYRILDMITLTTGRGEKAITLQPDVATWLLEQDISMPQVAAEIARREDLRSHPEVREQLLQQKTGSVAQHLIADLRKVEFRQLFKLILHDYIQALEQGREKHHADPSMKDKNYSPDWIVGTLAKNIGKLLEEQEQLAEETLEPEDLGPLFSFSDREIRLRSLNLLGKIQARESRKPESSRRPPR